MNFSYGCSLMKILTIIDVFKSISLAIVFERRLKSEDVLATLFDLFIERGETKCIRIDNVPEFTAKALR